MTSKEFNNLEEIQKYYDEESNTYIFKENDEYIDTVVFNFDLNVKANIDALDIDAHNINAKDITYYAVCYAYENITCNSIKGILKNAKHFVLDGKIKVLENGESYL